MGRFIVILTVLGGFLIFGGVLEYRLSRASKSEPQRISCADLGDKGPGDNAYVTLTDFVPSSGSYVCQTKDDKWTTVWMPLAPAVGGSLAPRDIKTFKVILMSDAYHNEQELAALVGAQEVTGLIMNLNTSIRGEQRKLLESSYPGVDLDSVWILKHNSKPLSMGMIGLMFVGGVVLLVPGVLAIFKKVTGRS